MCICTCIAADLSLDTVLRHGMYQDEGRCGGCDVVVDLARVAQATCRISSTSLAEAGGAEVARNGPGVANASWPALSSFPLASYLYTPSSLNPNCYLLELKTRLDPYLEVLRCNSNHVWTICAGVKVP